MSIPTEIFENFKIAISDGLAIIQYCKKRISESELTDSIKEEKAGFKRYDEIFEWKRYQKIPSWIQFVNEIVRIERFRRYLKIPVDDKNIEDLPIIKQEIYAGLAKCTSVLAHLRNDSDIKDREIRKIFDEWISGYTQDRLMVQVIFPLTGIALPTQDYLINDNMLLTSISIDYQAFIDSKASKYALVIGNIELANPSLEWRRKTIFSNAIHHDLIHKVSFYQQVFNVVFQSRWQISTPFIFPFGWSENWLGTFKKPLLSGENTTTIAKWDECKDKDIQVYIRICQTIPQHSKIRQIFQLLHQYWWLDDTVMLAELTIQILEKIFCGEDTTASEFKCGIRISLLIKKFPLKEHPNIVPREWISELYKQRRESTVSFKKETMAIKELKETKKSVVLSQDKNWIILRHIVLVLAENPILENPDKIDDLIMGLNV